MKNWRAQANAARAAAKNKAAANRQKKTRLGLLLGGLLATAGAAAGVKHGANAARANAARANAARANAARATAAANFRKGIHSVGTHHVMMPGNHSITKPIYQTANNKYYMYTGNGTGNIAGYTRVTKNLHALPAHRNWYKLHNLL